LIGLYVGGTNPDWFDRVVVGNGALPVWEEGTLPFALPENPQVKGSTPFRNLKAKRHPFGCLLNSGSGERI
jgi:hypothetical protein